MAAVGVEQFELAGLRQQGLVLVLAVDLDQQTGQFGELGDGDRAAVDPGPRAAVGAQGAAQLAGAVVVAALVEHFLLPEPGQRFRAVAQVELGVEFGAFGAVADHAAVGAHAGEEAEGIDQQRFAGAGFAGNDGHSGAEFEFGGGDDGEVAKREACQHGADCASKVRQADLGDGRGAPRLRVRRRWG